MVAQPPEVRRYVWGPVSRQRDRAVSLNTAQDAALSLLNVYLRDSDTDYSIIDGRPGFMIAGTSMGASAAVQWIGQLSKANGTEVSAVVCAGEIWDYNWGTDTLTKRVTTANLTTASITLSATARVRACEFADTLVFTDGINRSFTWDGTAGAGGLVSLTNGPAVAFGRPWVRDGKLWFFKNDERSTPVWSQEGQANVGYEAGGHTNAWTVRQTATEGFIAGVGTNDANVLFRGNSITYITGDSTPNYSSTANDEAISETVGCRSPDGVLNIAGENPAIYFLSNDRRVLRLEGRSLVDVGKGARARLAALNTAQVAKCFVEYVDFHEQGERIIVGIPELGSDDVNAYVVVNPATGLCEGTWTGWKSTAFGRWKNASGEWRLVHGGGDAPTTVDKGTVSIHDVPNGVTWNDEFTAGVLPITHQVETSYLATDPDVEKGFTEGSLIFQSPTGCTAVSLTVKTPRGSHTLTTPISTALPGGGQWNVAQWNIDQWGELIGELRATFATRGVMGRDARLLIGHATGVERFGLSEATLNATITGRRPTMR